MAKTNFQSVDEYHQCFSGEILKRLEYIRELIHKIVPDVQEGISYQIPVFKSNGLLIHYCAFDKHISLSYPFTSEFWKHFKNELEGYKTSKAIIQIPHNKPLPTKLINDIVRFRKKENDLLHADK